MRFIKLDYILEEKLDNILESIDTRKKIFVWGYRGGGEIVCNLLKQKGVMRFGIIDSIYENNELEIKKPNCLQEVNPEDVIILLSMKNFVDLKNMLETWGFQKSINYFSMVEYVHGDSKHVLSHRYWIEYRYGLDIFTGKYNRNGDVWNIYLLQGNLCIGLWPVGFSNWKNRLK